MVNCLVEHFWPFEKERRGLESSREIYIGMWILKYRRDGISVVAMMRPALTQELEPFLRLAVPLF